MGDEVLKVKLSEDTPLYLRGWSGAVYTDSGWQAASKSGYEQAAGNFGGINPLNFYATFLQAIGTGGQAANT